MTSPTCTVAVGFDADDIGGEAVGMKGSLLALLYVSALIGGVVAQSARASATPPQDVTITAFFFPAHTWTATGGITDGGHWTSGCTHFDGSFFHSPVVGTFQDCVFLTGADGSVITLQTENVLTLTDAGVCCDLKVNWRVSDGTGRYAGLRGEGRGSRTLWVGKARRFATPSGPSAQCATG